ncbi:MAG: SurA N-terminal domain-containing protein [Candidatus Blackburnbacteria bacterium]|nr:SurA N-terminal domain-containing protein [Candidatus Blackburnbacteria bacterium]
MARKKIEKEIEIERVRIQGSPIGPRFSKKAVIIIVVGVLLALGFWKKNWIIAATVNGSPVTFLEVLGRLDRDYKSQALDQLVSEKIILGEAKKNGVQVGKQEIDSKISDIEGQFGGTSGLDSVLSQQGQTRKSLEEQLKIQLALEKLYLNEATVSSNEVDTFIKESGSFLQSTDSAKQREEAEKILKSQKLSQVFSEKFQELKQQAEVRIF